MAFAAKKIIDFFVIGAQKAGTTALDLFLRQVPGIQMARHKEPHYFDKDSIDWSTTSAGPLHDLFDWQTAIAVVRGEATPIYSYWPNALERLQRYNPSAKLIMCLRHPAFRAYSHWHLETRRGSETRPFAAVACAEERSRASTGSPLVDRTFSYLDRGFYSWQVRRALSLFPRDQLHILRSDLHWTQPEQTRRRVLSFLNIKSNCATKPTSGEPRVTESMHALSPKTLAEITSLSAMYADDIRATEALTGVELTDWLDEGYLDPMAIASPKTMQPDSG